MGSVRPPLLLQRPSCCRRVLLSVLERILGIKNVNLSLLHAVEEKYGEI
jgi:hypothetical protein